MTVELPLKAIVRGFSWTVIPITWRNRQTGEAKLKIKEMGSPYLLTVMDVWLEKCLRRGDDRTDPAGADPAAAEAARGIRPGRH